MSPPPPIGKEKILEVALTEFAHKGFEGARVDRIALDAGVNKALIYYHFKNKEELYVACINLMFSHATPANLPLNVVPLFIREQILHIVASFMTFLHENPLFIKIMDQEVLRGGQLFQQASRQFELFNVALELYKEGVQQGVCRQLENPHDYIISLLGGCYFYYSHYNNIRIFYADTPNTSDTLKMRTQTMQDIVAKTLFI
jgi:TetR/AcrR family transcriptional regulator